MSLLCVAYESHEHQIKEMRAQDVVLSAQAARGIPNLLDFGRGEGPVTAPERMMDS